MVKRKRLTSVEKGERDRVENGSLTDANNGVPEQKRAKSGSSSASCQGCGDQAVKADGCQDSSSSTKDGPPTEEVKEACPQPTRTSSRVPRRPRRDSSPPPSPPKKPAPKNETKTGTPEAKTRRQWELWSTEDKDIFFDGLYEHGKDFDAIQALVVAKHRKRGNPMSIIKTKEQVRYFYYRTWHKISKFIEFTEDVSKQTLELYGLINYGELRKRVGGLVLNEKSGQKLNELVNKGSTLIKLKGKNSRIRTPVCRALKKLNNIEDAKEEAEPIKVPKQLVVELRPASNDAWARVQSIAHNPRLRVHLPPNRRLSSIISFLESKWKSSRLRAKEAMNASEETRRNIKLMPPPGCDLHPFDTEPTAVAPSVNLALENLRDNLKDKPETTTSPPIKRPRKNAPCDHGQHGEDSGQSIEEVSTKENPQPSQDKGETEPGALSLVAATDIKKENKSGKEKDIGKVNAAGSKGNLVGSATNQPANCVRTGAGKQGTGNASCGAAEAVLTVSGNGTTSEESQPVVILDKAESSSGIETNQTDPKASEEDEAALKEAARKEHIAKLRLGWTKEEAQALTIAEVYLMLGCPEKFVLEYDWFDNVKRDNVFQTKQALTNMLRRLVQLATTEFADFSKTKPATSEPQLQLGLHFQQSLSLRSNSPPQVCICGAQSGGTPPSRGSTKSPRVAAGAGQAGKSPSTPKNPNKPTSVTTPRTPGTRQGIGAPNATKQPEQSECATLASSQTAATGSASDAVFRVPNPVPIRPQVIRISPSSLAERSFLQQIDTVNKQPEIYLPRRPKKMMRNVRRPLVVQRTLLPKTGVPTRQIMTLAMLPNQSQVAQTGSFMPVVPGQPLGPHGQPQNLIGHIPSQLPSVGLVTTGTLNTSGTESLPTSTTGGGLSLSVQLPVSSSSQTDASKPSSGTSLLSQVTAASGISTSLSDITSDITTASSQTGDASMSSILDISIPAMNDDKMLGVSSFSGLLDTSVSGADKVVNEDSMPLPPSAHSPNKTYRLTSTLPPEMQWMGGDDFSLSQFLSDSPLKKSSEVSLMSENSRDSIKMDVDSALIKMMNENSNDYVAHFADLAAQMSSNGPEFPVMQAKVRELSSSCSL